MNGGVAAALVGRSLVGMTLVVSSNADAAAQVGYAGGQVD